MAPTGVFENPTGVIEAFIIDDTIAYEIFQFKLVQNLAMAKIFFGLFNFEEQLSGFCLAHKGSSFLLLYVVHRSTNLVLKIYLSSVK